MDWIIRSAAAALLLSNMAGSALAELRASLYKDPNCPCCEGHANYLRRNDFEIDIKPVDNLDQMSRDAGIPSEYHGCHVIMLDGYVIEGHVTIDIIQKLLRERPTGVVGIALPGMPTGVPGMTGPKEESYDVYAIGKDGTATVFARQ